MKYEKENLFVDEWFIGDEASNYATISNGGYDNGERIMKRTPTPYPSYETLPETPIDLNRQLCKYGESTPHANFATTICCWFAQLGRNVQILYTKLLFK